MPPRTRSKRCKAAPDGGFSTTLHPSTISVAHFLEADALSQLSLNAQMPSRRASLTSVASIASTAATTKPSTAERNIDNVVLGDVLFRAWYPSYYLKEIIGKELVDGHTQMLERLYVCKHCFKYSKELVSWIGHVRCCERRPGGGGESVPGRKIYTHGEGVWSVWEVDGEVDTLYCQNMSLFAKLFLDNKSVFFDVSGFNYFLLVHKDPRTSDQQVVGFFSKEKMSWDNNNLACILIFPPWQRKGLGAMLIAVSYEISKREEIMGGPEKPISSLGKGSYTKFWSEEIAKFLLNIKETDKKKGRGMATLEQISKGTYICVDDCLTALRKMDIAVAIGRGKGELPRVNIDKQAIREWAKEHNVTLGPIIDTAGFLEGYAVRPEVEDEVMGD